MAAHENVSDTQFGASNSEQLSMFMSAREITNQYQALDGDRASPGHPDPRAGRETNRAQRTDGYLNGANLDNATSAKPWRRPAGWEGQIRSKETDSQLWERKGSESVASGMTADINANGVQSPIRLGEQFGSLGKRQVVGGHHRIASQLFNNPDALMPVLHDANVTQAQYGSSNKSYPYT